MGANCDEDTTATARDVGELDVNHDVEEVFLLFLFWTLAKRVSTPA